jgi:signal recognition particle subunit SRP54
VTGKPILYVGMGEKLSDLEPFHPDRMASRILGMGDVLTIIEKAQSAYTEKEALEMQKKFKENTFTLDDYLVQFEKMKSMGNMQQMLQMVPGLAQRVKGDIEIDEKQIERTKAIILSMTKKERENPDLIKSSNKKRIAAGSGTQIQDVNQLLKQFAQMREMMNRIQNMGKRGFMGGMGGRFPF